MALGAAIGFVTACVIFNRYFFFGDDSLAVGIAGDAGSSFAGFRAFIVDGWHFPLLETDRITNPEGEPTVIAFTDSLPILALTAKSLGFLGIGANTWIGIWYYGNVVAQGAAAGLLANTHRVSSRLTTAAIAIMAVNAPIMMLRVWHPGLYGHFTILLAWAAAGHLWHRRTASAIWWFLPVMVLSLLMHPYVFVMNGVLIAGVIASAAALHWISIRNVVGWLAATGGVLLGLMYLLGYLPSNAVIPGGYGYFGMHVFSPFWPQGSVLWPGDEWLLLNENFSFEGFNYLGAGGIAAVVAAMALQWRRLGAFIARQQVLMVVLGLLALVAISHRISFWTQESLVPLGEEFSALNNFDTGPTAIVGAMVLAGVALFAWSWRSDRGRAIRPATTTLAAVAIGATVITALDRRFFWDYLQQFRASGRFFWVIGYAMLLGSIILIDRWFASVPERSLPSGRASRPVLLGLALVVIAGLQVADTGHHRNFIDEMLGSTPERVTHINALADVAAAHERVDVTPDWFCTLSVKEALNEFQDAVIATTVAEVPITNYYGGRTNTETNCATTVSVTGGSTLMVAVRPLNNPSVILANDSIECRYTDHLALCSQRWDDIDPAVRAHFADEPIPLAE